MAYISLKNIDVYGIDQSLRSSGIRDLLLHKISPKSEIIHIIRNLSFEAKDGDKIGLIGKNGCGKSSLMKVIAGGYFPSKGLAHVDGKVLPLITTGVEVMHKISGRDNIKLSFIYRENLDQYNKDIEEEIIDFSGLREFIDRPVYTYSRGMMARLIFSSCIMQSGDILLLDEVFSTGDIGFINKSYKLMEKKWSNAKIGIFISHSEEEILKLCNKCVLMENGSVVASGPSIEVINEYKKRID